MWNQRFSEPGYAYGIEPNDFLVSVADRIPRGKILSLAEGEGRNAVYLAGLGHEVTAVDSSDVGLLKANTLAGERGVQIETVLADLRDFPIEAGAWQGIVSIYFHTDPPDRARIHRHCVEGLAPGGVLVLVGFTPRQLEHATGGPKNPVLLMEPEEIAAELEGLDLEITREVVKQNSEGAYHEGTSAVLEILGVKPSSLSS